ncbi:MAG: AraC family transcriptional regulator [bacterium]|nr:AraC family transcriptional regulator [bacterium]
MENRNAIFSFDTRPSDSPYVDAIWQTQSDAGGEFMSIAETNWGMVITKQAGKISMTIRGAETQASPAPIPPNADFIGIVFKLGTLMPHLPPLQLVDNGINLPEANSNSFWFNGSAWQFPNYDNVDVFVNRLVREGILAYEPIVQTALHGHKKDISLRSVQRRFLRATGITHGTVYQIKRAHQALSLLENGASILDTVERLGYADQPHLTRSLKRFMGQTPAQILRVATSSK